MGQIFSGLHWTFRKQLHIINEISRFRSPFTKDMLQQFPQKTVISRTPMQKTNRISFQDLRLMAFIKASFFHQFTILFFDRDLVDHAFFTADGLHYKAETYKMIYKVLSDAILL